MHDAYVIEGKNTQWVDTENFVKDVMNSMLTLSQLG